ncbi:hypothetical protein TNCV_3251881 [Trichonephila clavipes]|nr:hypothetical protein TNCV_3251881 [Trichonephila clavipes]
MLQLPYSGLPQRSYFLLGGLVTSQRLCNCEGKSIQDRTIGRLCLKTSQPLTSLYPANREVTGAVHSPIFGFKPHRASTLSEVPPHSNGLSLRLTSRFACPLRCTVTYRSSHLRASQRHPNAAFHSDPALPDTSTKRCTSAVARQMKCVANIILLQRFSNFQCLRHNFQS